MGRVLRMRNLIKPVVSLLVLVLFVPQLLAREGETDRIERLLRVLAVSKVSFIIDGTLYTADEMARHLRDKLDTADKKTLTAGDFISRLANSSSRSGKPYKVVLENGQTSYAGPWLRGLLNEIERGHFQEATEGTAPTPSISP